MDNKYIEALKAFKINYNKSVEKMLNELYTTGYKEKYDIQIIVDGNKINIPLNADSYERLESFIDEEIKEEREL